MFHKRKCKCLKCKKEVNHEEFLLSDELSGVIQETYYGIGCWPNELAQYLIKSGYRRLF